MIPNLVNSDDISGGAKAKTRGIMGSYRRHRSQWVNAQNFSYGFQFIYSIDQHYWYVIQKPFISKGYRVGKYNTLPEILQCPKPHLQ